MSVELSDAWRRLEVGTPHGDSLLARVAIPDLCQRLQCGIDSARKRHLLIRLEVDDGEYQDSQSRGLACRTRELTVHGGVPGRYLDIECSDNSGHEIFDVLAFDLATDLSKPEILPADSVRRVLGRWRRFWAHPQIALLTREQQIGLFSELWFLAVWMLPRIGAADAIDRWIGPTGARHDFSWHAKAVEAKATMSNRGRIFRINGLEQLVPPSEGALALFGMRLQEDSAATNSLPALVDRIRTSLLPEPDALGRFETSLAIAGYSLAHAPEYEKLRVIVREERLFRVEQDFPRLTPAELVVGTSQAIERVEYEINLNGFDVLSMNGEDEVARYLS